MPEPSPSFLDGAPNPPGATYLEHEQAWNFSLASRHASGVTLLLYDQRDPATPILSCTLDPIRNRTGTHWHVAIPAAAMTRAAYYAYRVEGPRRNGNGGHKHAFDPDKILHDPYAKAVYFPPGFDRQAAIAPGSNAGRAPLSVLPRRKDPFDWGDDHPIRHAHDLIIYELHVRGFTRHPSSGVPEHLRGTFAGLVEKIPYLLDLGVTAIELMPVYQFDPQEGNYWGYMPLSFFATHQGYASAGIWASVDEFRGMVRAMHRAGIEVLIDSVHNHTGEGDEHHPTYSLKGIDNASYYHIGDSERDPYRDFTGTGNSLNPNTPEARQLAIESLRYWIEEMHVDGFRHDLASVVMRGPDGSFEPEPHAAVALMAVRELQRVRHVVEPWDPAGGYLLGKAFPIPGAWQWNGKFRDDLRRFVRGDPGLVGPVMQRLYGSDDLFPDTGPVVYRPCQSVNYIASHDGFTLHDLLSYTTRRNLANGHDNTDGPQEEFSTNCGFEGESPETPPATLALRARLAKNFAALLLLANGTPMLRAGDEFLHTQRGNNNPYNQDNETSWLDWRRLDTHRGVRRFFKEMIAFRKAHPSIARPRFWREDVRWFGPRGDVDFAPESRAFGYILHGASVPDDDLAVAFNMGAAPLDFTIPLPGPWVSVVDTSRESPDDILTPGRYTPVRGAAVRVEPRSLVVLLRPRG